MNDKSNLIELDSLDADAMGQLLTNSIGIRNANLYTSEDELFGSEGSVVHFLFLELYLDDTFSEYVEAVKIHRSNDDWFRFFFTDEFYPTLAFYLNFFFAQENIGKIRELSEKGKWELPKEIAVHIFSEHPVNYEEQVVWTARFRFEEFPIDLNSLDNFEAFMSKAQELEHELLEKLSERQSSEN
jgi:hypothetical protein